jgi:acetamidase/formamidase
MQVFERSLLKTHCVGAEWPDFLGRVELGESFIIETESDNPNGPISVAGILASDDIAVHIEKIEMVGPFLAPNGGPFVEGMGPPVPLEYRDGWFYWPEHFLLRAQPSVGNVAVLPAPTEEVLEAAREFNVGGHRWKNEQGWRRIVRAPRYKHCHQDCRYVVDGSIVHLKAQVDGAGLCMDDVHGYIGEGELSFSGIEVAARVQVRVERSTGWLVDWPLIETPDEIMVHCSYTSTYAGRPQLKYVDVVREAYRALREVVAARIGGSIEEANSIVATAADLRNCALYGLGEGYIPQDKDKPPYDIAVVAALPKAVFLDAAS